MKTPQPHTQADQTHSAAPSTSQPRQAQQASPEAAAIAHSPRMTAQRQAIRAAFGHAAAPAQLQGDADQQLLDEMPASTAATQRATAGEDAPNLTGMPNQLKSGIEALSGLNMSDVRVHRNSDKPAQLSALAYAQGNDIHLGPGKERHLGHEAWHVVQQRQGRVRATMQMVGMVGMVGNDDAGLEKEADLIGGKAAGIQEQVVGDGKKQAQHQNERARASSKGPVTQRVVPEAYGGDTKGWNALVQHALGLHKKHDIPTWARIEEFINQAEFQWREGDGEHIASVCQFNAYITLKAKIKTGLDQLELKPAAVIALDWDEIVGYLNEAINMKGFIGVTSAESKLSGGHGTGTIWKATDGTSGTIPKSTHGRSDGALGGARGAVRTVITSHNAAIGEAKKAVDAL